MTRPVGLDFGAVMQVGMALGVDTAMLADILPRLEAAIINPADLADEQEEAD